MLNHEEKQEIFTRVWTGMKAQGFRISMGYRLGQVEGVMYRGRNGYKCSLGHLIPDEKYKLDFEGMSVDWPESANKSLAEQKLQRELNEAIGFDSETDEDLQFFSELQSIHDDAANEWDIEICLRAMASEKGFELPDGESHSPW